MGGAHIKCMYEAEGGMYVCMYNTLCNVLQCTPRPDSSQEKVHLSGLVHLPVLHVHYNKGNVPSQNGSVIRNVHLSIGPFKWSALYVNVSFCGS